MKRMLRIYRMIAGLILIMSGIIDLILWITEKLLIPSWTIGTISIIIGTLLLMLEIEKLLKL